MRLDKHLSNAGYGTRSGVKKMIRKGIVAVNGTVCRDPSKKVTLSTPISINSKKTDSKPVSTIMLNKPLDYISSNENEAGYPSVMELIYPPHPKYAIAGRLDVDTTGLMILSTQGDLVHSIISPSKDITKTYIAKVIHFKAEAIQSFYKEMTISEDLITKPVTHFEVLEKDEEITTVSIGITEGKFHQVKRMFQFVQAKVVQLKRIAIGSLQLDPFLKSGEYRELSANEISLIFNESPQSKHFDMLK